MVGVGVCCRWFCLLIFGVVAGYYVLFDFVCLSFVVCRSCCSVLSVDVVVVSC